MIQTNTISVISLKEEETVLQILAQVGSRTHIELDQELQQLIRIGEAQIQAQYESRAQERMLKHRLGINFQEIKETIELQMKEQLIPEPPPQQQSELLIFQQQIIKKSKLTQRQILDLDKQLPKLNFTGMVGRQQSIFQMRVPQAAKWISFKKLADFQIQTALMCIIGEKRWIILGVDNELIIFMGQYEKEPTTMPLKGNINALAISPCKKYIAVGVSNQISIYQIRKASSIVLLKNFPDLKIADIVGLKCYQGSGPRVCFTDNTSQTGIISLQMGMFLTKVKIDEIVHKLKRVDSVDVIRIGSKMSLMAIGGANLLRLVKIQPQIQYLQNIQVGDQVICSWRKHKDKIQLVVASQNKMTIYRLIYINDGQIFYLEEHLLFLNHYQIENIYKISTFHYLLQSPLNFSIVALPLIPSVVSDPQLALSEAAIVYSLERQPGNRVIFGVQQGLLLEWDNKLQIGKLKSLEQQIDQLIIQKSAYREAFSILVLVAKGISYSFKFSYQIEDLRRLVYAAVDMAVSAIIPSLDERIVLFRVGWAVQLCIQCGQQALLWSYFYPRLKQKNIQMHLFNMIQIFILKGQIVSIPEDIFIEIIAYYSQKRRQQVIEKLFLSNRQQYEPTKLLSLLNQREMNYLQFYLFSRAILSDQNDFYTPFIRSFSAFSKNLENQGANASQGALLCYWILYKTFSFEHVPYGQMTRDTKVLIASTFFLQTLSKTFVRRLSDYNLKIYLECYLLPFLNSQFLDILSEQQTQVMKNFKDFDCEGQIAYQTQFVNAYLGYLDHCVGVLRISPLFSQYYGTVLFLTKSNAKFQRIIQILASLFQKKFYHYGLRATLGERPTVAQLKQYLLDLIKDDLMKRQDRLYIKKLLAYEDREVGHLLYRIDKNYQSALQLYLGNYGVQGLFSFIISILRQINELPEDGNYLKQRKKLEVRGFIIKNIGLLFRVDSQSALQLCYTIGQTTQKIHDIVFKNPFQNNQRIYFLTAVLTRWTNQQFQFKQQYQLEHLEQVCMLPQTQMRYYLDKFYYPLDSAIKVADRKNNYLAKAILEMRSGLIEQAFSSFEKLIRSTLVANKGEEQTKEKVNRYITECITICKQFSGQSLQENLWVRLIKFLASFVASQHQYKVYLKVQLQRANQNIINQMLQFLSTSLLINFFTAPSIPLPLYKLIPIFIELFRMIKFDRLTIQRSMLIIKLDILDIRKAITSESRLAISINHICDFCRGKLQQQSKCITYSCGHAFHLLCHQDPSACLTCSYQSDDSLIYRNIYRKNELKKQPGKAKEKKKLQMNKDIFVQTKYQALLQNRKKRLKLYDFQHDHNFYSVYDLANPIFKLGDLELTSK